MVFSSLIFIYAYLPLTLGVYYLIPARQWQARNFWLFIMSLVFYAWGEPVYVFLMLGSIVLNWGGAWLLQRARGQGRESRARGWMLATVAIDLVLLGVFKYAGFIAETLQGAVLPSLSIPHIALPIGISFYTFQIVSYVIDLYRGDARYEPSIVSLGMYITMFPQLIAGPIVRFTDIQDNIGERRVSAQTAYDGISRFLVGMAKKVLIANPMGEFRDVILSYSVDGGTSGLAWLSIFCYTLQIYYDFSGYSDMAIGLGRLLGFDFPENFDHPYISRSVTEFWRRWHMTLSSWFREYVYIPLGGNRKGLARQLFNLLVVWSLTGLWHGAAWNFVLWGLYFVALLIIEKRGFGKVLDRAPAWLSTSLTLFAVMVSWILFASPDISHAVNWIAALFGRGSGIALSPAAGLHPLGDATRYLWRSAALLLVVGAIGATPWPQRLWAGMRQRWPRTGEVLSGIGMVLLLVLTTASLVASGYNPFLYFRF